jgi:hypothetical protein
MAWRTNHAHRLSHVQRPATTPMSSPSPIVEIRYPSVVTVDNHRACNAMCRMCPTQNVTLTSGLMSDQVFDALATQVREFATRLSFVQFGVHGEPLLDKALESRIGRLVHGGVRNVWVATNGSAMTPARAEQFLAAGTEAVIFSVDGVRRETYERIRIGLRYDAVVNNVLNFIKTRNRLGAPTRVVLRFISQSLNKHEYGEWATFWTQALDPRLDSLHHVQMHNWAFTIPNITGYGNTPCSDVLDGVLVSADGRVPLCCLDFDGDYDFGNILKTHILDIFNSAYRRQIQKIHIEGRRDSLKKCDRCYLPEYNKDENATQQYYKALENTLSWNQAPE